MNSHFIVIASEDGKLFETFFKLAMENECLKGKRMRCFHTEGLSDEQAKSEILFHINDIRKSNKGAI
jgi:hypothetical protein